MLSWFKRLLDPMPEPDGYSEEVQLLELLEGKFVFLPSKLVYAVRGGVLYMSPLKDDDLDYSLRISLKQIDHKVNPLHLLPDYELADENTLVSKSTGVCLFRSKAGEFLGPFLPSGMPEEALLCVEKGFVCPY